MAIKPIRIPHTTKPPVGTPLDWSNPLAQGLVGVWAFNEGVGSSAFSGSGGVASLLNPLWSPHGLLFNRDTSKYATAPVPSSTAYSVFSIQAHDGTANIRSVMDQDDGTSNRVFQSRIETTSKPGFIAFNTAGSAFVVTADNAVNANTLFTQCVTAAGTNLSLWSDGAVKTGTLTGTLKGLSGSIPVYFGRRVTISQSFGGLIQFVSIYNRALSPSEIASLSANPWQVYEPVIVWVESATPPEGGSSLYTLINGELKQFTAFKALIDGTVKDLTLYTLVGGIVKPLTTAEAINAFLREDARYILREDGTRFAREA